MIKKGQEDTVLIQETLDGSPRAQEKKKKKYSKSVNNFLKDKYT